MTSSHRKRLALIVAITVVGVGFAAGAIAREDGIMAWLGVFALVAILPAALIAVIAYVWSRNDREDRARGLTPPNIR